VLGEVLVGQVEGRRDRQVLGLQQRHPVSGGRQVGGQLDGGPGRMVFQLPGDQPDRQRQVPAQPGDLTHRGIGGVDSGPGRKPGQ